MSGLGSIRRRRSSSLARSGSELIAIQPIHSAGSSGGFCEILRILGMMSFDIGKKKLGQGQEQASGKDKINYYGVDMRNGTCGKLKY